MPVSSLAKRGEGKPLLVYFYSTKLEKKKLEKIERKMFGSDELAMASKFYKCLKLDANDIESQDVREKYAKKTPAFYVIDTSGKTVRDRHGITGPKSLAGDLIKAYKSMYKVNLSKQIGKFTKSLKRMEELEELQAQGRTKVKLLKDRLAKRDSKKLRKQVEEAEENLAKVTKEMKDLQEERVKLMKPPKKDETLAKTK